MKHSSERILITGGAGFIGSYLTEYWLSQGHFVTVFDNFSTGSLNYLPVNHPCLTIITADICQKEAVFSAVKGQDYVVHLAAQISVKASLEHPEISKKTNIDGSFNILEACRHHIPKKLFFASSAAIYGTPQYIAIDEQHPVAPLSPYGLEKLTIEHYLHLYSQLYHIPYVVGRFFNIYGNRQNPASQYAGVIALFMHSLLNNIPIQVYGDGLQTRDFVAVHDIVRMIDVMLFSSQKGTFNCGTGIETSIQELIRTLADLQGEPAVKIDYLPALQGDISRSVACMKHFSEKFDYKPLISLEQGLCNMSKYYHL